MNNKITVAIVFVATMFVIGLLFVSDIGMAAHMGAYACQDSDGGINYNIKGTAYGLMKGEYDINRTGYFTDRCVTGRKLNEYYCSGIYTVSYKQYTCPTGQRCQDGACLQRFY